MAANNKQYLIPGYGFVDEKNENEQWLIPGYGFTDEEAPAAGGVGDVFFERLQSINLGIKPLTAAGMGGVLQE